MRLRESRLRKARVLTNTERVSVAHTAAMAGGTSRGMLAPGAWKLMRRKVARWQAREGAW